MYLEGKQTGRKTALPQACVKMISIMFKITQNTFRDFSLAEVLLMAAINQLESKRKASGNEAHLRNHLRAEAA